MTHDPLGQMALKLGLITPEQLEEAIQIQQTDARPLGAILLSRRWIHSDDLARILRESEQPIEQIGEYRILQKLGEGGAAQVFLGEHASLKRLVAIKILSSTEPSSVARFRREALVSASLDHPNIVRVYDTGEFNGRAYIVMQYIQGSPIAFRKLNVLEAARAMEKVAQAVHYAHGMGVLHRDIKPENILMDEAGEVYLADFGLGREIEGERISLTGTILGTPNYMPPEQARGDLRRMDARSDVYSLGATLYDLVTGRPPFDGSSALEIAEKVCEGRFDPPRKIVPGVARDLEVIILKAMAHEQHRRYETAKEFADDVHRFLSGDTIRARPTSVTYRLVKAVRRRPLVSALLATVLVAAASIGGIFIPGPVRERMLREEAQGEAVKARDQALQMLRRVAQGSTHAILSARRRGEGVQIVRDAVMLALKDAYQEAAAHASDSAEPDYLMGRVERALMNEESAERYQEQALARQPNFAPSLYEHVILMSRRYSREFKAARRHLVSESVMRVSKGKIEALQLQAVREPTRDEVETSAPALQTLRAEIEEESRRLSELLKQDKSLGEAVVKSATGIFEFHLGQKENARIHLREAVQLDPTLEEAFETLALMEPDLESRIRGFAEGLKHDAGYLGHLFGRGSAYLERANRKRERGENPFEDFQAAESDYAKAILLDPGNAEGWARRGEVRWARGSHALKTGADPSADFDGAETDLSQALNLRPSLAEAWLRRGWVRRDRALYKMSRAEDPVQELQRSLDDLTRAVDEDKNNATAWCVKGSTLADIGYYQGVSGSDATSSYQQAETDFTRALELDKDNYLTWMYRARVRENMGNNLNSKGENGASLISAAEQDLAKAIELRPDNPEPWAARAYLRTNRASLLSSQKKDPSKEFEAALEDCEQALKVNPDSIKALVQSGLTHHQWGVHKMNHGQDATPDYDAAELNPTLFTIWENRAFALINVAYYKRTQKQDPLPDYNQSEKWFQTALHLNDRRATTWMNFGQLYWARGWYRQETGRLEEARKDFSSAVRAFEEALRRNPALEPTLRRWLKESREKSR